MYIKFTGRRPFCRALAPCFSLPHGLIIIIFFNVKASQQIGIYSSFPRRLLKTGPLLLMKGPRMSHVEGGYWCEIVLAVLVFLG